MVTTALFKNKNKNCEAELAKWKAESDKCKTELDRLKAENDRVKAENDRLRADNDRLRAVAIVPSDRQLKRCDSLLAVELLKNQKLQVELSDSKKAASDCTVKLADAFGIPAKRVEKPEDAMAAIKFAQETPGPVLIEFRVEMEEAVYPMVPAGAALNEMLRRPIQEK